MTGEGTTEMAVVGTGGELNLTTFSVHRAQRPADSPQKGLSNKLL